MRIFFLFLTILALCLSDAEAKVYIDLAAPAYKRLPLAIQDFKDLSTGPAERSAREGIKKELLDALDHDMRFSGLFTIIDRAAFLEDPSKGGLTEKEINFKDWRASGADTLIKGSFTLEGDRLTVEVRFFDCVTEKQVVGKRFTGSGRNPRRIAHFFSDALYEELTGRKGVFSTKFLFVSSRSGNKEIYSSDYDGKNAAPVTRNLSINLAPQWSPDGTKALYVSYKKGAPALYAVDLSTGKDEPVSVRPGINIGGRFSPDGKKVALTLSSEKSPELFLLELGSRQYRKLTDNHGIDVSPSWSPDGGKLAYVSDTSGNPHIHVLDLSAGTSKRITFSGKYNSSPSWSPDGSRIAFARSDSGKFNIWVARPDGADATQLTFEGDNRSPSWSPDGRSIVFSSTSRGATSIVIMRSDGTGATKVTTGVGGEKAPAWSPYLH